MKLSTNAGPRQCDAPIERSQLPPSPRRRGCRRAGATAVSAPPRAHGGFAKIRRNGHSSLEIRRFRGFEYLVIVPTGHALVVGEPRAGRSDVIEGLRRVLSADSTRSLLGDNIDFFQRDRTFRAEVEVVLGDLGPALTQQFFDWLEYWDRDAAELVELLDDAEALNNEALEQVVRLCYRAEWVDAEEVARHWVDYPKTSDPAASDFQLVRRADREALPFFMAARGSRPLSLTARAILRRLIDEAHGADFTAHLEQLLDEIARAAAGFGQSAQVREALELVVDPARQPLGAESRDVNDLLRFAPEGGALGAVLRSLSVTADLADGAGFIALDRHGSTVSALFAVCELLAIGGSGVVAIDDLGEDVDAASARHLAATLGRQARQAWVSTRRAAVAEAFRSREIIRLAFDDGGRRVAFTGWEPVDKAERMFARHFALQVLPAVAARALIVLEGPHDRAAYSALADRLFRDENLPLPAARRIAFADGGAAGGGGGSSVIPKLAEGAPPWLLLPWPSSMETGTRRRSNLLKPALTPSFAFQNGTRSSALLSTGSMTARSKRPSRSSMRTSPPIMLI
jgi:putative ATP-dependent endonuclease of the OLD family